MRSGKVSKKGNIFLTDDVLQVLPVMGDELIVGLRQDLAVDLRQVEGGGLCSHYIRTFPYT